MDTKKELKLMEQIAETNRHNFERWKAAVAGLTVGFMIDPVAGSAERIRFAWDDLPTLFETDKDDILLTELRFPDGGTLMMLYRETPGKPVSLIGETCSLTGTIILTGGNREAIESLTDADITKIRGSLAFVQDVDGTNYKILFGCEF